MPIATTPRPRRCRPSARRRRRRSARSSTAAGGWPRPTRTRQRFEAEGRKGVVRLKMPREGQCRFNDLVRGEVEFDWANEQDHVIQRADGTLSLSPGQRRRRLRLRDHARDPREEHLSNTPRQIFIVQGLGYPLPEYAHLPYVAEPGSKNKLSKRKIAQYLKNPDFKRCTSTRWTSRRRSGMRRRPKRSTR